ncbi:MAG: DUF4856 domain-containing protein [Bacteroidia bacterium]|nr:DUF4856 domain-containing protein [Bacteroidia bacterium]
MKNSFYLLAIAISASVIVSGCKKDEETPQLPALSVPAKYDTTGFSNNTTTEALVKTNHNSFVAKMKEGRVRAVPADSLNLLFVNGSPSLASLTVADYRTKIQTPGWLTELSKASGNTYTFGNPVPGSEGGVNSNYLFDENGLELGEVIDKGMFAATHYNHAITLLAGTVTPATVDKVVSIFGAHPTFPNTDNSTKAPLIDAFSAKYAARRDKNDGLGLYSQMKYQLTRLKAAVAAGNNYAADKTDAIAKIKLTWEKILAATTINYLHSVISTLSGTNLTDANKASAMHSYAEAVGFLYGLRYTSTTNRKISDTDLDDVLTLMNAPLNATPTSYLFVTDPVNQLPKLTNAINRLKIAYGFSDQEIEDFKQNWVNAQGR